MSTYDIKDKKATRFDFWLVFHKDGPMKMTRNKPGTSRDERAMFMQITLPNALWATPELKASIEVASDGQMQAINVEGVSEALKAVLGVDVDVRVVAAPEPSE